MTGGLFFADAIQLLFRRGLRHEIVHAGFGSNGRGGERVVARNHHRADTHFAKMRKPFLDAALHYIFQMNDAQDFATFRDDERRSAGARNFVNPLADLFRKCAAQAIHVGTDGFRRAFADGTGRLTVAFGEIHTAHARLRGERDELCVQLGHLTRAQVELLFRQNHDGTAFGCFVGKRRELRGIGEALRLDARRGQKCRGHAIAEGDGASLVEQQHIHVAGRLHGAPAHRQNIALEHAIHAGNADGAQQSADGRGNQTNQQRNQNRNGEYCGRIDAERFQCHTDKQENERQRSEQNGQRDFVGRLLALRAFDQRNHAIQEAAASIHGDANNNAVAEDARAAGDSAPVAAALTDDRRGFAGDGRFVHAGDAIDHIAVGRNHIARFAHHGIAFLQIRSGDFFFPAVAQASRHRFLPRFSQAGRLGFAPAFGHRLRKIGEEHREPQPDRELRDKAAFGG